ncbi:MAG: hypothetical protein WAV76_06095 [Bacteroidota bacterium]
MNLLSPSELSDMLSNYIDGSLSAAEKQEFEIYIHDHPSVREELAQLEFLKHLLTKKKPIEPNIAFWTRLSLKIEDQKKEASNLLPFPRKYAAAFFTLASAALVMVGIVGIQKRAMIYDFITRKSQTVQVAYETNILKNRLLPFFSSVNKDQALQFSLFGTLALDEKNETTLHVDGNTQKGYHIEVRKTVSPKPRNITYRQFVNAIKPTEEQTRVLDSLLELAGRRIGSSILVGENSAFAVDPSLPKLNRVMVTSIAANLEPTQRVQMERLMANNEAPYVISGSSSLARIKPEHIFKHFANAEAGRKFIVITSDTTLYSEVAVNIDSLQQVLPLDIMALQMLRNRMIKNFFIRQARPQQRYSAAGEVTQINEDSGGISVEVKGQNESPGTLEAFPVYATPRLRKSLPQPKAERLEIHTGDEIETK